MEISKVFELPIEEYLKKIIKYIQERFYNVSVEECLVIKTKVINGNTYFSSIRVQINDKQIKNFEHTDYVVRISECIIHKTMTTICTPKYSYELRKIDGTDLIRFDYKYYDRYPSHHINAIEKDWGNHLTFPDKTNINLEKIDCFKAIDIFCAYLKHPTEHILDKTNNERYLKKI